MKTYNKLVRDRIPEIITQSGSKPVTHIATDDEYEAMLKKKLHEEVNEFLEEPSVHEYADILEVLYALSEYTNIDISTVEKVRAEKATERGGFKKRIILDRVE